MTDLAKNEIIKDKKGNHYRFVSLETTQEEADAMCFKLVDSGFQAATFQREDNKLFEVFRKLSPAEEAIFIREEQNCKERAHFEDEIHRMDRILEKNPQNTAALVNKGGYLAKLKRCEEALKCIDKALEIDPKNASAWTNKGSVLLDLKLFQEAISCYNKAIAVNPRKAGSWLNKGLCLDKLGLFEEAIKCYDEAMAINPREADVWLRKGGSLFSLCQFKEALKCYDKGLEINPDDADAWTNKGDALANLGQLGEATKNFEKALEIDPKKTGAWIRKGIILYDLGKFEEAIHCYNEALETNKTSTRQWFSEWLDESKLEKIKEATSPKTKEEIWKILLTAQYLKNYTRTSIVIIRSALTLIREKEIPDLESFAENVASLLLIFREEFVKGYQGQNYRGKCFNEVLKILTESYENVRLSGDEKLSKDYQDFWEKLNEINDNLRPMSKLASDLLLTPDRSIEDSMMMFHSFCYLYLVGFEALFENVIKRLYQFFKASQGDLLKFEHIDAMNIWRIIDTFKQIFKITPVFLESKRYGEITDIRNAIAHAQVRYSPETDQVHLSFVSVKKKDECPKCGACITVDKTLIYKSIPFSEFISKWLEIADVIDSFSYISAIIDAQRILIHAHGLQTGTHL